MANQGESKLGPVGAFVRATVQAMMAHPDAVQIWETQGETVVKVEFRVHGDDEQAVIGQSGETIKALRTLANVVAQRHGQRLMFERRV